MSEQDEGVTQCDFCHQFISNMEFQIHEYWCGGWNDSYEEPDSYEGPDEAQEWHDFDPDA